MSEYPRPGSYTGSMYEHGIDAKIVIMGNTGKLSPLLPRSPRLTPLPPSLPPLGVGKTSLLQRYTQNKFDPKNTTSTTGAFFVTKKVYKDGLKVRLQLWDTAGQERFRSMVCWLSPSTTDPADQAISLFHAYHLLPTPTLMRYEKAPMYYRGANAALLLYDITNAATFESVRGWLEGPSVRPLTLGPTPWVEHLTY